MKTNNIELKQKKVIKFVKNYFSNNNSPLIKKNYFALYEDGEGKKKIQEKVFDTKQVRNIKYYILNTINLITNFKYNILSNQKNIFLYDNLIITWGKSSDFLKNGTFSDKYFLLNSDTHKNAFWIVLSNQKIKKNYCNNIAVVYPEKKIQNFFYFFLYTFKFFFSGKKSFFIDQDQIIANCINNYISNNVSLSKIKNLIMPYEGQAFQKIIFFEQKKLNKKLKTYGFDHSAPHSLPTQMYYTLGSPKTLLVSGLNTQKCYSNFYNWPKKKIIITFPNRYKNYSKKNFSNNLFLPYDFDNDDVIVESLDFFLNTVPSNSFNKINIKIHPVKLADKKHILLKRKLDSVIRKYKKKFCFKPKKPITIVVGFTTAAIVALEFKMQVLHICPNLNFDPYSNCFWGDIDIVKINNYCFLYKLNKNYKYLNFSCEDKIKKILK
jgi:hypothetical protein